MNGGSTLTPTPSPDGAGGPVTGLGRPPGPGWEQVGRPGHTERAPWRPNRRSWPDNHRPEQRPGPGWDGEYAPALQPGATPPPPMLHIRQQGALRLQPTHQLSNASRGVGKASRAIFVHRHVQYPFAHVDPCCRLVHLSPPWSWCDNGGAGTLHTCIAGLTTRVSVRSSPVPYGRGVLLRDGATKLSRPAHLMTDDAPLPPTPQIGPFAGHLQHTNDRRVRHFDRLRMILRQAQDERGRR